MGKENGCLCCEDLVSKMTLLTKQVSVLVLTEYPIDKSTNVLTKTYYKCVHCRNIYLVYVIEYEILELRSIVINYYEPTFRELSKYYCRSVGLVVNIIWRFLMNMGRCDNIIYDNIVFE
ncbi:unnamed protein product [marine sediment metagenome]|uniref:Uncharacterized protein n=1 Tax=marine sediment metagenome TaxID=412755 RepID=X0XM59_9ZZZZ